MKKWINWVCLFSVRALRTQRPAMVQTEDQYQFCYRAALEYLSSFDQLYPDWQTSVLEFGVWNRLVILRLATKPLPPYISFQLHVSIFLVPWNNYWINILYFSVSYQLDMTKGQEVEFHEIKIHFFMRSKLNLFMRSNLFINIWQFWSGGW